MFNTSRLAGETIGVAVIGTILVGLVQSELVSASALQGRDPNEAANQVLGGNIVQFAGGEKVLIDVLAGAFTTALHMVLGGMLVIALLTAGVTLVLMRGGDSTTKEVDVS